MTAGNARTTALVGKILDNYLGVYCRRCRQDCLPINGICPWCSTDLSPADDPATLPPHSPLDSKEPASSTRLK